MSQLSGESTVANKLLSNQATIKLVFFFSENHFSAPIKVFKLFGGEGKITFLVETQIKYIFKHNTIQIILLKSKFYLKTLFSPTCLYI